MIFCNEITKECWFHTNGHCKFGDMCVNEHKRRCTGKVITGICNDKDCTNGHPILCRNIEKERTCSMYDAGKCLYLHPINYYGKVGGYQNNRNGNNRSWNNNEVKYNNSHYSHNNGSNGYHNRYGGSEDWSWGNNGTNYNNWNNAGYREYDDRNRWGYGNGWGKIFQIERNYCDEWPTPWEGRILRMMERRMDHWWDENKRQRWW